MSDALAGFREIPILPKKLGQLTVEEVQDQGKTELIEQIYTSLKKMKPETSYHMIKRSVRKRLLIILLKVFQLIRIVPNVRY